MRLTADHAHVLLDAINIASSQADATNYRPWDDYDGDERYDEKVTRSGWYGLLEEAREALGELVNRNGEVEIP